jgi:hypothetical protein
MPKSAAHFTTSPLHNLPLPALVDEFGALKAQIAELETREKALRTELIDRGSSVADGTLYSASITEAIRWTLDAKAVRSEMGDAWWNTRCRQGVVTTVAVKARAAALQFAA